MQAVSIQNQNFQGKAMITGSMNQNLRSKVVDALKNSDIAKKTYNLYINNTENDEFLSIVAKKNPASKDKYTVLVHRLSQKASVIKDAVQEAFNKYEKLFKPSENVQIAVDGVK